MQRYEPLAVDGIGDVPNEEEDLRSVYVTNDEDYLYFMIEYIGRPGHGGVVVFLDVDLDGLFDHHVRVSPLYSRALLCKAIRPSYPAPSEWVWIAYLKYAYERVVEFRIPLKMMNCSSAVRMQIFSWSEKTDSASDGVPDCGWITYEIKPI